MTEIPNWSKESEEWWETLTEFQQQELIHTNPHIPNSDEYKRFQIERDKYGPGGHFNSLFRVELIESLQGIQNALERIADHLQEN
tara:strand:- start:254 stop:508 length:255 start_codon:yes stop_codon:yes gene_type:complete